MLAGLQGLAHFVCRGLISVAIGQAAVAALLALGVVANPIAHDARRRRGLEDFGVVLEEAGADGIAARGKAHQVRANVGGELFDGEAAPLERARYLEGKLVIVAIGGDDTEQLGEGAAIGAGVAHFR